MGDLPLCYSFARSCASFDTGHLRWYGVTGFVWWVTKRRWYRYNGINYRGVWNGKWTLYRTRDTIDKFSFTVMNSRYDQLIVNKANCSLLHVLLCAKEGSRQMIERHRNRICDKIWDEQYLFVLSRFFFIKRVPLFSFIINLPRFFLLNHMELFLRLSSALYL